jgi:hypothetical protein
MEFSVFYKKLVSLKLKLYAMYCVGTIMKPISNLTGTYRFDFKLLTANTIQEI